MGAHSEGFVDKQQSRDHLGEHLCVPHARDLSRDQARVLPSFQHTCGHCASLGRCATADNTGHLGPVLAKFVIDDALATQHPHRGNLG